MQTPCTAQDRALMTEFCENYVQNWSRESPDSEVLAEQMAIFDLDNKKKPLFIAAPMVRYSKLAFRKLVRLYDVDLAFTPMIIAESFVRSDKCRAAEFSTEPNDRPLIVQFAATTPNYFADAAELVYGHSTGVDLNCGCPQRWAMAEGFGCQLLKTPELVADMVKQTRARIGDPDFSISVKVRLCNDLRESVEFCRRAEAAGCSFVTVHGRRREQRCEPPDLEAIGCIKAALGIPVYSNGECNSLQEAYRIAEITKVDGLMSARGLLHNPGLFVGYQKTPMRCVYDWIEIASRTNCIHAHFRQHLIFMLAEIAQGPLKTIEYNVIGGCGQMLWLMVACLAIRNPVNGLHVTGQWESATARISVVAQFGFQQLDPLEKDRSWGHIYGNVTSLDSPFQNGSQALLLIIPQTAIALFYAAAEQGSSCHYLLQPVAAQAYDSRCRPDGLGDLIRRVPCPKDRPCAEEDEPLKLIPGAQFSLRVEEPYTPELWYVALVACRFDSRCNWTALESPVRVLYDIWLVNGSPQLSYRNPFVHQFSFDEQNSAEIYMVGLFCYFILLVCQWKSTNPTVPLQLYWRILSTVIILKTIGFMLNFINLLVFAFDGRGFVLARLIGELARVIGVSVLCLLLLLLAVRLSSKRRRNATRLTLIIWSILSTIQLVLVCINFVFVDDLLHDVDVFKSWPGYGIMLIRIVFSLWFLNAIRAALIKEVIREKAEFLAHFGAGFLVWFVYLPALGVIASQMSPLWRFKIILGITTIANFFATAMLLHIFWPTNPRAFYFLSANSLQRQLEPMDLAEISDMESLLASENDQTTEII